MQKAGKVCLPIDIHFLSVLSNGIGPASRGLNIGMPCGTPLVSVGDGKIIYAGREDIWMQTQKTRIAAKTNNNLVVIKLKKPITLDDQPYSYVWYGNLSAVTYKLSLLSRETIRVKLGETIGRSGKTDNNAYLNFRLISNENGSLGEAAAGSRLSEWLWKEVAQAQLGMAAI